MGFLSYSKTWTTGKDAARREVPRTDKQDKQRNARWRVRLAEDNRDEPDPGDAGRARVVHVEDRRSVMCDAEGERKEATPGWHT